MGSARLEKIQFFTPDELRRLLAVARRENTRDYALILTAYRHGLRAAEIRLLQEADIDFTRMQFRVQPLKGSSRAEHLMQPDEVKAVKACLAGPTLGSKEDCIRLYPGYSLAAITASHARSLQRAVARDPL